MNEKHVNLRMPHDLVSRLMAIARREDRSFSYAARQAIERGIMQEAITRAVRNDREEKAKANPLREIEVRK